MEDSQPAQENGIIIKKNINSSTSVMYISVCPVSYVAVVMFTCTLVRSHPELKINHDIHEFILDSGTVANRQSVIGEHFGIFSPGLRSIQVKDKRNKETNKIPV
jgi:hypothetical protein